MVAALVDGHNVLGEKLLQLGDAPPGEPFDVTSAVRHVVALVAGDVFAELSADGAEQPLDLGLVGGFEFARVLPVHTQFLAGPFDDIGLVGLAVVVDEGLRVDHWAGGGLRQPLIDAQDPVDR